MKMFLPKYFTILFLLPLFSFAQLADNFSDGDFTNSPAWAGNTTDFTAAANILNSIGPQASSVIYLSTANTLIDSAEWNFLLRLDFNPSSTNQVRIFLVSDQPDLSGSLNGYFIQFGETGTAPDSLDIFKQSGTTTTKIFTGASGIMTSATTNSVRIRVVRHTGGTWDVYADKTGGTSYTAEGSFTDNTIISTNYFGVVCDYSTASRYNLYYFDDFSIGNIATDTTKPMVANVNVLSSNAIDVKFSEPVEITNAQTPANYPVNNGIGNPSTATRDGSDFSLVHLTFSNAFVTGTTYTLNISGVNDLANNTMNTYSFQFALAAVAEKYDVLINEIFPDPTPQVGLPNAEFVELYNRSNKAINLKNWNLTKVGSTGATLSSYLLLPDSFIIITGTSAAADFAAYGYAMGVASFPALTNTGDQLLLKDSNGTLIHYVDYDDTWYHDNAKADGGWTLELIDAQNPCNGKENWRASMDATGGTPDRKNSVATNNPDTILPQLVRATLEDNNTLLLYFSEPVNNGTASLASNYVINNGVGSPLLALPVPFDYTTVRLEFGQDFSSGVLYSVKVSNLTDCSGNPIGMNDSARFAIADSAQPNDIVINEILFNPRTGGYDFVELYNRSSKVIDLKTLDIQEKDISDPQTILEQAPVSVQSYLLFPQEFVVLTENTENIQQNYLVENPNALLQVTSLPNYDDNQSICVLRNHNSNTIDSLAYDHNWHFALLDVEDGVSLERIDYNKPTQDKSNWHSAASTVGFATPTYRNSQFSETGIIDDEIKIEPEVFTPDNDGEKDFTYILYKFSEAGYVMNAKVYDTKGREIRTLAHSELLGSEGKLMWDGIDDDNQKARTGIYIVSIEIFNLQGKVKRFKKQVVLGAKLN